MAVVLVNNLSFIPQWLFSNNAPLCAVSLIGSTWQCIVNPGSLSGFIQQCIVSHILFLDGWFLQHAINSSPPQQLHSPTYHLSCSVPQQLFYRFILSKMSSISQCVTCFWSLSSIHHFRFTVLDQLSSFVLISHLWFLVLDSSSPLLIILSDWWSQCILYKFPSSIYLPATPSIILNVLFASLTGMATIVVQELGLPEQIISLYYINAIASQHLANPESP